MDRSVRRAVPPGGWGLGAVLPPRAGAGEKPASRARPGIAAACRCPGAGPVKGARPVAIVDFSSGNLAFFARTWRPDRTPAEFFRRPLELPQRNPHKGVVSP